MTLKRDGYKQFAVELPESLLEQFKEAAEKAGMKFATWVQATLAKAAGVEYEPPKLGRPVTREPEAAVPEPKPKKRGGAKKEK